MANLANLQSVLAKTLSKSYNGNSGTPGGSGKLGYYTAGYKGGYGFSNAGLIIFNYVGYYKSSFLNKFTTYGKTFYLF